MDKHEQLAAAGAMLAKAAELIEGGGWPGLAQETVELADAVDVAASTASD